MTDRTIDFADLDHAFEQAEAMLTLLYTRAREDIAGAVLPGQSYEPQVSGARETRVDDDDPETVPLTATERAVTDRLKQAHTYRAVVGKLRATVDHLVEFHADITPNGARCGSTARDPDNGQIVECERLAERKGFCGKCWKHVNAGQPPDAKLLRDWNGRLDRDCECSAPVCGHPPGGCESRIRAGERGRSCPGCRQRRSRAARAEEQPRVGGPSGLSAGARVERGSDGSVAIRWHDRPA